MQTYGAPVTMAARPYGSPAVMSFGAQPQALGSVTGGAPIATTSMRSYKAPAAPVATAQPMTTYSAPVTYGAAPQPMTTYAAPSTVSYAQPVTRSAPVTYSAPTTYSAPMAYRAPEVVTTMPAVQAVVAQEVVVGGQLVEEVVTVGPAEVEVPMLQIYGLKFSPNIAPMLYLLEEVGVPVEFVEVNIMKGEQMTEDFKRMNPMHSVPTIKDGDFTMWETGAILRYICNKYQLEQWYPSDPMVRALCDMMMDFRQTAWSKVVPEIFFYPAVGFGAPKTAEEQAEGLKKFETEIWASMQLVMQMMGGGPFVGGAQPNIADLMFLGHLVGIFAKAPDSPIFQVPGVLDYLMVSKEAMARCWGNTFGVMEAFWPTMPAGDQEN